MLINLRNALMAGKRLPYDAEVEYLRVDAVGPYIVIDGVTYCNAVGTYYAFTISSGGVVTHDLIPVRLGNTGYMYDRITNKRFGNAGTGDFVLGQDVVPVEYIESHGTEYINTGIVPTSLTRFDVDMQFTSMPTTYWGCGTYALWPTRRFNLGASTTNFNLSYGDNNDISASVDTARHSYSIDAANQRWAFDSLNGSYAATVSSAFLSALLLFARNNRSGFAENMLSGRVFSCNIWEDGDPVRSFRPVRVGTDATSWDGAMMDVLTRRIYRNAGTGAFTYGNDLKYPIPAE